MSAWTRRFEFYSDAFVCSYCQMATSETSTHFLPNLKDPSLLKNLGLIGGKWVGARDGKTMPVS
jgi:hypothetical protein